ncbi:hypothetical protein WJ968_03595 [Achromobacter xylosoxidans]
MRVERIDPLIQDERGLLLADGHHPLQLDRLAPDRDALQRLAFTAQLIDEDGLRGPFLRRERTGPHHARRFGAVRVLDAVGDQVAQICAHPVHAFPPRPSSSAIIHSA